MENEFRVLLATENKDKIKELLSILPKTCGGRAVIYLSLSDLEKKFVLPAETGLTLEENAAAKAIYAAKKTGLVTLADDTGLEVDALNGAPGVRSARYAGLRKNTAENNEKLLSELEGLFLGARTARFKTAAALAMPNSKVVIEEGVLEGLIALAPRGTNGFGYDPLFIVKGKSKTLAEMTEQEKNTLSHRRIAFEKIAAHLESI